MLSTNQMPAFESSECDHFSFFKRTCLPRNDARGADAHEEGVVRLKGGEGGGAAAHLRVFLRDEEGACADPRGHIVTLANPNKIYQKPTDVG